ncbi:kinase-like domain-containing protein [Myxozyma melibiosi]|uniref:Kinase-like domain-containing protein n=1 Tax=Myxozyma melibiosi TaxID=54550 RepID=A0ABR1FE97_9ASCO
MAPMAAVESFSPLSAPARTPGRRVSPTRSSSRRGSASSSVSYSSSPFTSGRVTRAAAKHPLSHSVPAEQLSPLRRSTGVLHLDQASLGSPVPKRSFLSQSPDLPHQVKRVQPPPSPLSRSDAPPFPTSPFSAPTATTPASQSRPPAFAKSKLSSFGFGKKDPPAPPSATQLFKVRRTHSVENLLARDSPFSSNGPLPSASSHPHPLSQSLTPSNMNSEDDDDVDMKSSGYRFNSLGFAAKKKRPSLPGSASWSTLSNAMSSNSTSSTETPPNYRLVKPFQPAFMSTGLLSKRNRQSNDSFESRHFATPETPCKRPAQPQFSAAPSSSLKPLSDISVPDVSETFEMANSGYDYEMPPTPTKAFGSQQEPSMHFQTATVPQGWSIANPVTTPVDSSFQSISPTAGSLLDIKTPSTPAKPVLGYFNPSTTPGSIADSFLHEKFQDVSAIGSGEFSSVFLVTERDYPHNKYAIKRSKTALMSHKALKRRLEEVEILKDLSSRTDNEDREYIINYINNWEYQGFLYIMTDYCENGSLDVFLAEHGRVSKLDEWRVWKILVEIALGLRFIHDAGYIHLDLKPANVFITFEGSLKIGDFGMATKLPATKGIEREGDREYIAPEVLALQEYSKPADIFSFGLIMLEIAANIVLPDNGAPWHKLRSGDLSDAGRLSSSSGDLANAGNNASGPKIPSWAPSFMADDTDALDRIVKWMLRPNASERPTIEEVLEAPEVQLVDTRRKAGAIIFEGEYGPKPDTNAMKEDENGNMLDPDDDWRMEL